MGLFIFAALCGLGISVGVCFYIVKASGTSKATTSGHNTPIAGEPETNEMMMDAMSQDQDLISNKMEQNASSQNDY